MRNRVWAICFHSAWFSCLAFALGCGTVGRLHDDRNINLSSQAYQAALASALVGFEILDTPRTDVSVGATTDRRKRFELMARPTVCFPDIESKIVAGDIPNVQLIRSMRTDGSGGGFFGSALADLSDVWGASVSVKITGLTSQTIPIVELARYSPECRDKLYERAKLERRIRRGRYKDVVFLWTVIYAESLEVEIADAGRMDALVKTARERHIGGKVEASGERTLKLEKRVAIAVKSDEVMIPPEEIDRLRVRHGNPFRRFWDGVKEFVTGIIELAGPPEIAAWKWPGSNRSGRQR